MDKKKIFLILFFLFQVSSSNSENVNSCLSDSSFQEINKIQNLNSISITISNSKKWMKNIFLIIKNHGWIPSEYKKTHKANINFFFNNGLKCNLKAKIKFHGDNPDHYIIVDDLNVLSSLNIKLTNSNIDNITEFILFLPHTRGDDIEIITTNLLRELGFFAPRTKKIKVKVNGLNQEYLLQEKISKEFIESYGFTEGPIIEGDQRLLKTGLKSLQLSRIVNKNWVKKNWRNTYIALNSLSRVNELYLKFYNSIDNFAAQGSYYLKDSLSLLELENYKNDFYSKNLFYDRLVFSMGGRHALVPDNRTFYYNYIENNFYPIYYDGDISIGLYKKNKLLNKVEFSEFNIVLNQLKNLNLNELQAKNFQSGVKEFDLHKLESLISQISKNYSEQLNEVKELKINEIKKQDLNNYYERFNYNKIKLIFFSKKPNEFLLCNYDASNCNKRNFSLNEIAEIVSQRYREDKKFIYIFVSSDFENYKNKKPKVNEKKWKKININKNFYAKITKDEIDFKFDIINKEIFIKQKTSNGRVIFFSKKTIKDWRINFVSIKELDENDFLITKDDMDGCITFYNSRFQNLILSTSKGFCEDSINLIRSEGSIKEIYISDAFKDGLDMDFSNINIENIHVKNSGNDCVDLSFGNYKIENFILINCFDNGISVGEKSNLVSNNLNIKNSKIGLAVKDSSKVIVDLLNSENNEYCFKVYNKKQEFLGGNLILKNMNCSNNSYEVEHGSKFILKNDI